MTILVAMALLAPQANPQVPAVKANMEKLAFLIGDWEGTAWMEFGGRRSELKGKETVRFKAGGTAIAVDGMYSMMAGGQERVVHDAFAVISWAEGKGYSMTAYVASGHSATYPLTVSGKGYQWTQINPTLGGEVRYTMKLTDDGHWIESGERKDGDKWVKFMELNVAKKSG